MAIPKETLDQARAWFSAAPSLDLEGMELRDYQVEAGWSSYLHDTLVVLPTGLGKTMVSVLHAGMVVADMRDEGKFGKVIATSSPAVLARVVQDFHKHVKDLRSAGMKAETEQMEA